MKIRGEHNHVTSEENKLHLNKEQKEKLGAKICSEHNGSCKAARFADLNDKDVEDIPSEKTYSRSKQQWLKRERFSENRI